MSDDLLVALEQNKGLIASKTYQRVIDNFDKIPDEVKKRIIVQLQNATRLKDLIDEYDSQRIEALKDALIKFQNSNESYTNQYNDAMRQIEAEEQKKAVDSAEGNLKQINN